jgi:hypothetical protein
MFRATAEANGRVGIGDEFDASANNRPSRRLHVHDPGGDNANNSQLRISQNFQNAFVDFRTTTAGNMFLRNQGDNLRLGIQESAPQQTLDVKGNARFQNVPSSNTAGNLITGITGGSADDITLSRLAFNNNANTYLSGTGQWMTLNNNTCTWTVQTNGSGTSDVHIGAPTSCQQGRVGIGTNVPAANLDIVSTSTTTPTTSALRVYRNSPLPIVVGVDITSQASGNSDANFALRSEAYGKAKPTAGWFRASYQPLPDNTNQIGATAVHAIGRTVIDGNQTSGSNMGVYATAGKGVKNLGVMGFAQGEVNTTSNVGGWFEGYPVNGPAYSIYAIGSSLQTGVAFTVSDQNYKNVIAPLSDATHKLMNLNPQYYKFRVNEFPELSLDSGYHFGLISQDVENVIPEIVRDIYVPDRYVGDSMSVYRRSANVKAINYTELIPILIQGFKEQQLLIDSLSNVITSCCQRSATMSSESQSLTPQETIHVKISQESSPYLGNAVPNPNDGLCKIEYYVPENAGSCYVVIFDANGRLIKTVNVSKGVQGIINLDIQELSSGIYSYTLFVDGLPVKTNKIEKN